jgi:hypothetical protein
MVQEKHQPQRVKEIKNPPLGDFLFVWDRRIVLDSKLAVAHFGLDTASWFCLLTKHHSAVRFPHASKAVYLLSS